MCCGCWTEIISVLSSRLVVVALKRAAFVCYTNCVILSNLLINPLKIGHLFHIWHSHEAECYNKIEVDCVAGFGPQAAFALLKQTEVMLNVSNQTVNYMNCYIRTAVLMELILSCVQIYCREGKATVILRTTFIFLCKLKEDRLVTACLSECPQMKWRGGETFMLSTP